MKEKMYNAVDVLKARVNYNLERLRENEKKIKDLVNLKEKTDVENEELIEYFNENKQLLAENKEAINLQMSIIQFISQYRKNWDNEKFSNILLALDLSDEDLFDHTVDGKILYNDKHPKFGDQDFKDKLLEYYSAREDYEMCNFIMKTGT
ncbi:MAG: hypothetical protein JXB17_08095 [Bacteroidales bacterium]|nr:hypothetical protein [Bacteroidales bacterium]